MKKIILMLLSLLLVAPTAQTWAAEKTSKTTDKEKQQEVKTKKEKKEEKKEDEIKNEFQFQGWLDQSLVYDADVNKNNLGYGLFEAAIRMSHAINSRFGGRLQLNARWTQPVTTGVSLANGHLDLLAREAYAYVKNPEATRSLKVGKFYIPIGFELADPVDLYQFTNSNVFREFLPTEGIGLLSGFVFNEKVDLQLYVAGAPTDNDFAFTALDVPTIGTRLGINAGKSGNVGISAVYTHRGLPEDPIFLLDIDGAFRELGKKKALLVGFEGVFRANDATETQDLGFMAMVNYRFSDITSLTARWDIIAFLNPGEVLSGLTLSPTFRFAPGWDLRLEGRMDFGSTEFFTIAGEAKKYTGLAAVELIYQFGNQL